MCCFLESKFLYLYWLYVWMHFRLWILWYPKFYNQIFFSLTALKLWVLLFKIPLYACSKNFKFYAIFPLLMFYFKKLICWRVNFHWFENIVILVWITFLASIHTSFCIVFKIIFSCIWDLFQNHLEIYIYN